MLVSFPDAVCHRCPVWLRDRGFCSKRTKTYAKVSRNATGADQREPDHRPGQKGEYLQHKIIFALIMVRFSLQKNMDQETDESLAWHKFSYFATKTP